jgi:hypothetical protein
LEFTSPIPTNKETRTKLEAAKWYGYVYPKNLKLEEIAGARANRATRGLASVIPRSRFCGFCG